MKWSCLRTLAFSKDPHKHNHHTLTIPPLPANRLEVFSASSPFLFSKRFFVGFSPLSPFEKLKEIKEKKKTICAPLPKR
jgi:hypothetical protein